MTAAVRIDNEAFSDPRFELLGQLAEYSRHEALGRCALLWGICTDKETDEPGDALIRACIGTEPSHLVAAGLAEKTDTGIRVKGVVGRIEWLQKKRRSASAGGNAKAAKRLPYGRQMASTELPNECLTPAEKVPKPCPLPLPLPLPKEERKEEGPAAPTISVLSVKPKKPRPPPSPEASANAELLRDLVLKSNPSHIVGTKPSTVIDWARQLDAMHRLDKRPWTDIGDRIRFAHGDQNGTRFRFVVESASSLREKYDRITAAMVGARATTAPTASSSPTGRLFVPDFGDVHQTFEEEYPELAAMVVEQRP